MKKYYEQDGIVIYHNDNLKVLSILPDNHINLIYCDVLYNTGKTFDDYDDNLGTPMEAMEWYRPRFLEMKRVLATNGSIFIHCNWRIDSYLRILLDEIFGVNAFKNRIYRKHSEERGFYENFDSQMDVILYYVKDVNNFVFNEQKSSTLRIVPMFENGYIKERSFVVNHKDISFVPEDENKHWLLGKNKIQEMIENNELTLIDGLPYRKTFSIPIGNLWDEPEMLDDYSRNKKADTYDTPKPLAVIERIIKITTNEGDTVADFFLGGGSTAVATKNLNRRGIFCDISEKACNTTINKLKII